jgi:hypothetical protein
MRAQEFVTESKRGEITKRQRWGTRGLHKYSDEYRGAGSYSMNRIGMAAASTDGDTVPNVDRESWVGLNNTTHPYTEVEAKKLKQAYRAAGVKYTDLNSGDMRSQEPPGGNDQSPIRAFKGYPR